MYACDCLSQYKHLVYAHLNLRDFQHALQFLVDFQSHEADTYMRYAKRAFTSLRNTSSSIRLKPILSIVRSNIKSHPLRRILLTLDRTRRTSSRSWSHASRSSPYKSSCGWRRDSSFEIHSFASLTKFSTSSSLYTTPIVASSFILPPIFSATITPILPDGYFFLRTNIVKIPFVSPNIR